MYKETRIERNQLYELVWSKPMTEVAEQFEVSDKSIAKICDKLNVPYPEVGYWRKIEVGEKPSKRLLPDVPPNFQTYQFISKQIPDYELVFSEEAQRMIDLEKNPANKIVVPRNRGMLHFLIKRTEMSLKLMHTRSNILTSREAEGIFKVSVSKAELSRALRILNTLVKELEKRKFLVYIDKGMLKIKIFGQEIGFSLTEKLKRIKVTPKQGSYFGDYDHRPTGILMLSIEDLYTEHKMRKNFEDNLSGKVEEKLNEFIVALITISQELVAQSKHRDEQHKIWEAERRKKEELQQRIKKEEQKVAELFNNIELFHKANIIRKYAEVLKQKSLDTSLTEEERNQQEDYIRWALEQADRLDPLVKSPGSILDLKEKVSGFFWDVDE